VGCTDLSKLQTVVCILQAQGNLVLHSGMPAADQGTAKGRSSVIGPWPGWCEVRADMEGGWIDADPLLLYTTDPNNHANEFC
jgi:hypothetical protein